VTNRCPICRTAYGDDARFCSRDGSRLISDARTNDLSGQTLDDKYEIQRKLGAGGMSVVYLATDARNGAECAIKVLSPSLTRDRKAMTRLRREAGFGMRLEHPNICNIIELVESDDGTVYIVMPFLVGELLVERIHRQGFMALDRAVQVVQDVACGLSAAHALGIVHRDLKPENIMLSTGDDRRERAVIMDFGLAKDPYSHSGDKLTKTGIILGTPEFMSPEQLRGKPLDGRSDIYALALVTFEMLTGQLPFEGETQQEMMMARLNGAPRTLRQARPNLRLPAAVDTVLEKALRREPKERYATAMDFADALTAVVPEAVRPSTTQRGRAVRS
jgi:eukaryotic-like serine/threonine-protein kinase